MLSQGSLGSLSEWVLKLHNGFITLAEKPVSAKDFYNLHVLPVVEESMRLVENYGGDKDVVYAAALLHDIARLENVEPHARFSASFAQKGLCQKGFSQDFADKVGDAIVTHSCFNAKPQTLEQKIIATADALACFKSPIVLWLEKFSNKPFREDLSDIAEFLEKNYNEKIFFPDEKESIKQGYMLIKSWYSV